MESDTTPAVELHPGPPGVGKKIVVVDHSKLARKIIREELEADGFEVFEADHADEVYSILATTPVDAITLSVELAGQNGYEISSRVNSEEFIHSPANASGRRLPIVFITSKDTLEGRKHGFESGAADFVSKPFVKGEVSNSIKKILFPESRMQGLTAVVVDDGILSRQIVANYLSSLGVIVLEASNGDEGFRLIRENIEHVDMVITDLMMPGMKGDELCFKIRKELNLRDLPVMVLSGAADSVSLLELFRAGATDYLMKPFLKEELLGRLTVHLEARLLYKKLEMKIAEMREMNQLLKKMATIDPLTRVPNRRYFFERFAEAVHRKERYDHPVSMFIIDIDHFKGINDNFGHQSGDWLLKELAAVLKAVIRKVDIAGRMGGEEFGILAPNTDEEGARGLADKILRAIATRHFLAKQEIQVGRVTVSIGIYTSRKGDGLTPEEIYRRTDARLFKAKNGGRNRYCIED